MQITINFDMDGTIADLYGRTTWLEELRAHNPTPYQVAKPMVNMSLLARYIHKLQEQGIKVNIISWLSKDNDQEYAKAVTKAKMEWLAKHLPSVTFDNIHIVPYGTPKSTLAEKGKINYLFDDEWQNIYEWTERGGQASAPQLIFEIIKKLLTK